MLNHLGKVLLSGLFVVTVLLFSGDGIVHAEHVWFYSEDEFQRYVDTDSIKYNDGYCYATEIVSTEKGEQVNFFMYRFYVRNGNLVYDYYNRTAGWEYVGGITKHTQLVRMWQAMKPYIRNLPCANWEL